jgi:hypothetical protein
MQLKKNYVLLTAIFPKKVNTVYAQLENCILSITRLKQNLSIFIVTNNKHKVLRIIKNNNIYLSDLFVENINASKKNYLKGHKLSDFKYAFGKIQSLRIFLKRKIEFNSIIISDIDCIFTKRIKFLINKKNIIFTALEYYFSQEKKNMEKIFSFFLKQFDQVYWLNSGFILLNQGDAIKIMMKIDEYFPKFVKNGKLIKKTIGHYGDEILFTLASNSILKKNLIVQNKEISCENIFDSRLLSFIWTVNTKQNYLRFLNPFKVSAHIHLPDLKISKNNQNFIKSILLKFRPDYADFILSMWVNFKILKNKIFIIILSNLKNFFFK